MALTSKMPSVEEDEKYLIGKAAKKLGINRETLRRYAKGGFIDFELFTVPSTVPGREYRTFFRFTGKAILEFWYKNRPAVN